jgi:integrase
VNARRRKKEEGLPGRVYKRSGAFFWVRNTDEKWIKLCRLDEGETRMLERLAEERRKIEVDADEGSLSRLVAIYIERHKADYAESFRKEWCRRGEDVRKAFSKFDILQLDAGAVEDFLRDNWRDKLPTQRAMKGWLSKFFSWAVLHKHAPFNPCREVKVKKPKKRTVLIGHKQFLAIREALATYTYEKHVRDKVRTIAAKVPTGPMMQVFVDLCYLTCQRSTEIRLLKWTQVDREAGVIHFIPTKTEDSSGEAVDWPITPEIDAVLVRARALEPTFGQTYVVRDGKGKPKTDQACRDAWEGAMKRCGLEEAPYTIKDIRAMALTDANNAGYNIDELQVAGAHTDRATTEGYIRQRQVPLSTVRLVLPAA